MTINELINNMGEKYDEVRSDNEKAINLIEKAMELENYDLMGTIAILEQRPDAQMVETIESFRRLGYKVKSHAKSILIPLPITRITYQKDGKFIGIGRATKEEKLAIVKGQIPFKSNRKFMWIMGYDIADTDCPLEDYYKHKNYHYNDVTHKNIYTHLCLFAERLGLTVEEYNLSGLGIDGYFDENKNKIVIGRGNDSKKLKSLCTHIAEAIIIQTSSQPNGLKRTEAHLLSKTLQFYCQIPVDLNNLKIAGIEKLNTSYSKVMKTTKFVSEGIAKEMDFTREQAAAEEKSPNKHEEMVNQVSENFMMNL